MYLLIGSCLKIFYWNNFRYLPIYKWFIDWFSPKIIWGQIFIDAFRLIIIKKRQYLSTQKSRSRSIRICFYIFNDFRYF
ncbi:hypothetical protein CI766_19735 [Shigella sonnei]|uniref:Uncharacterized protein n=1 Tax=Escherichia coli TaxID=562 RepID=A0A2J7L9W7_ECOLX|nr:hypothetical protein [Escherichia coli]OYK62320.1 hypothetical protein CI712_25215 [Shigella sonnei]EEW1706334.1 hypothetical protein [Escherichia coli]EEW2338716.1 hypothetical protein [Escherichia coli]EEW2347053.1 hypothetical protein [Escherichia coli]